MLPTLLFAATLAVQDLSGAATDPIELVQKLYETNARQEMLDRAQNQQFHLYREQRFARKFNDLTKALEKFGQMWNCSRTIDPAQVNQLEKAWRDLEKTDAWFNTSADE